MTPVACYKRVYSILTSEVKDNNVALCLMIFLPKLVCYLKKQIILSFKEPVGGVPVDLSEPSQFTNILDLYYRQQIVLKVLSWSYGLPVPSDPPLPPCATMTLMFNPDWTQLTEIR